MNYAFLNIRYLASHNSDSDLNACLDEFGGSGFFGSSLDRTQPGTPGLRWRQRSRASFGGACPPPLLPPYRRRPRGAKGSENRWELALCSGGICHLCFGPNQTFFGRTEPRPSPVGIVLLILAAAVMPWLARQKRQLSAATGSAALRADAAESAVCGYLALIALGGLAVNAIWKVRWADPVAALALVPLIVREGWEAMKGRPCCATD
jgi:Cation efflux family